MIGTLTVDAVIVCLSVCHKSGVLLRWLNLGSRKQCRTKAQGLWFSDAKNIQAKFQQDHPNGGAK